MRLVVADTSPLNYLVLIGQVEILPALFERIFVPQTVENELRQNEAPESVDRSPAFVARNRADGAGERRSRIAALGRGRARCDPARDPDWGGPPAHQSSATPRMCWTPCWLGIPREESREIDGGRRHKVGWGKFATGISCEIVAHPTLFERVTFAFGGHGSNNGPCLTESPSNCQRRVMG